MRLRTLGLALMAVFVMSAVIASAAQAEGPEYRVAGAAAPAATKITFSGGETKLITKGSTIKCTKVSAVAAGPNEIFGGAPGTGTAKLKFESCTVKVGILTCEVKNTGGTFPNIELQVNDELVYGSKAAAESRTEPLGILFETTSTTNSTFVELQFSGLCSIANNTVTAVGEVRPTGIAGVACEILPKATEEKKTHEINCKEKEQTAFWTRAGGVVKAGTAGLKFNGEVAEQVGKGTIELTSKELWSVKP